MLMPKGTSLKIGDLAGAEHCISYNQHNSLARIDGIDAPEIYCFHNQPNGPPVRMTNAEVNLRWEGQSSAWGKQLRETTLQGPDYSQNIRMQGWPCKDESQDETSIPGFTTIYSATTTLILQDLPSKTR